MERLCCLIYLFLTASDQPMMSYQPAQARIVIEISQGAATQLNCLTHPSVENISDYNNLIGLSIVVNLVIGALVLFTRIRYLKIYWVEEIKTKISFSRKKEKKVLTMRSIGVQVGTCPFHENNGMRLDELLSYQFKTQDRKKKRSRARRRYPKPRSNEADTVDSLYYI